MPTFSKRWIVMHSTVVTRQPRPTPSSELLKSLFREGRNQPAVFLQCAVGRSTTLTKMSRIFTTSFASVYPHYVTKVERKGRTKAELDQVIEWLTGFDESALSGHLAAGTTFEDFFADARLNPHASLITGVVCGVRVEHVDDPLMQKIRYLDKLVDELAKGKSMDRILRA